MSDDARAAGAFDKTVGVKVRRRRLEIGMSQERLAALLGVTFQQVQKYEKGVNRIAAGRLWDIAQALEIPIGDLYPAPASTAARAAAEPLEQLFASVEGVRVARAFLGAPEAARRGIAEIVERVARVAGEGGLAPGKK